MAEDNDGIRLSRRKALAGLGSIGAATALGGVGTWAQFTDTESESVTFTAGGIDGKVRYGASYNGNDVKKFDGGNQASLENVSVEQSADGIGLDFDLVDVKPGDYGCFSFGIEVVNNPAWVAACIEYENDSDGRVFEPEVSEDPELDASDIGTENAQTNGEIPHNMLVIPFYGGAMPPSEPYDPCVFFDPELEEYQVNNYQGSNANATPSAFWDNATGDLTPATLLDILQQSYTNTAVWGSGGNEVTEQNIVNAPSVAEGCVFLNGELTNENEKEAAPIEPGSEFRFGWDWHVPFDTGNEMQGDRMTLNLGFSFTQTRHTESAVLNNVFAPGQNTPN